MTILDCIYDPHSQRLTNLTVRHLVNAWSMQQQVKCCYSPSGEGYLISGRGTNVYTCSLANYNITDHTHHKAPVISVAVNQLDTLLASGDQVGRIILWRRIADVWDA